jgi:hypothetical protein
VVDRVPGVSIGDDLGAGEWRGRHVPDGSRQHPAHPDQLGRHHAGRNTHRTRTKGTAQAQLLLLAVAVL